MNITETIKWENDKISIHCTIGIIDNMLVDLVYSEIYYDGEILNAGLQLSSDNVGLELFDKVDDKIVAEVYKSLVEFTKYLIDTYKVTNNFIKEEINQEIDELQ